MEGGTQKNLNDRSAGPARVWWQWMLGIGLLATAAFIAAYSYIPGLRNAGMGLPTLTRIEVSPELPLDDVVPAAPGDLTGSNVLLVTFDTTRADRIGCYGHDKIETPAIDRLAREGVVFSEAVAPSPTTLPSHASILTGLYPYHHGARANNLYHLADEHETLAEVLSAEGYSTAAMVSSFVLDVQFGLDQGFGLYDAEVGDPKVEHFEHTAERRGDETMERAGAWLREHADEKFFLWVHFYDPHFPYAAPKPFSEQYASPYDAEIAFTDVQLGNLLAVLDELDLSDNTLVVMAGDHGEGLGQHQELRHACLVYDSVMRVPLVMSCGTRLGGGVHVNRLVSLVDIMPTVLSLLGVAINGELDGVDLTGKPDPQRTVIVEAIQGLADHGWAPLLGVRQGSTKLIYGPGEELYDLEKDPFEQDDLRETDPELAVRMRRHLEAFFGDDLEQATLAEPSHQLSAEDLAKLQSLGYLAGGAGAGTGELTPSQRPHPRDMMPLMYQLWLIDNLEREQGRDEMIAKLEEFAGSHPEFSAAYSNLGKAYLRNGDYAKAEAAYARCLELRPGDVDPLLKLAHVKYVQRQYEDAIMLYRQVLERIPDHFSSLDMLSKILIRQGEFSEAIELIVRALDVRPHAEKLPDRLLEATVVLGRTGEAKVVFERLLEKEPNLPMTRNALARMLAGQGEVTLAAELLRVGVELAPQQYELSNNLAFLLVTSREWESDRQIEAAVMMERVCIDTSYKDPRYLFTLSVVYAALLRVDEAIIVAEKARRIASESDRPEYVAMVPQIGSSLQRFRQMKSEGFNPALEMLSPEKLEELREKGLLPKEAVIDTDADAAGVAKTQPGG